MTTLLVVEDGREYLEFFQLFLKDDYSYRHAQSGRAAMSILDEDGIDMIVLDMRFDRTDESDLLGDEARVADDYFGGDRSRAQRYIKENQGTMILAALREESYTRPVLFVHDMPPKKLENLRALYGRIYVVPRFDAAAIRAEISKALERRQ